MATKQWVINIRTLFKKITAIRFIRKGAKNWCGAKIILETVIGYEPALRLKRKYFVDCSS